jgi:hypothetical protein
MLPFQGEKLKKSLCSQPAGLGYVILAFQAGTYKKGRTFYVRPLSYHVALPITIIFQQSE